MDRDVAPEGATLEESNKNLDAIVELAAELMQRYDIKLLWNTCNLFAHPRSVFSTISIPKQHNVAEMSCCVSNLMAPDCQATLYLML